MRHPLPNKESHDSRASVRRIALTASLAALRAGGAAVRAFALICLFVFLFVHLNLTCFLSFAVLTFQRPGAHKRKPRTPNASSGPNLTRLAERQYPASLPQQPPRITRFEPVTGPVGLVTLPVGYVPYQS